MNLGQQVCSLKLTNRLRDIGVKQESVFWWCDQPDCAETVQYCDDRYRESCSLAVIGYSAFTVAELGEMLPKFYKSRDVGGLAGAKTD
jgi:hypothetical protein